MIGAVNYARHSASGHYVFLAMGERPDPSWLTSEWSWWEEPRGESVRKIGDTPEMACKRTEHRVRICSSCRAQLAGIAMRERKRGAL